MLLAIPWISPYPSPSCNYVKAAIYMIYDTVQYFCSPTSRMFGLKLIETPSVWVIGESFRVKRSSGRAGSVSDLLHSLVIYLFQQEMLFTAP